MTGQASDTMDRSSARMTTILSSIAGAGCARLEWVGANALEATMKPVVFVNAVLMAALLAVPVLRADVKTTEKTSMRFEGLMGAMMNRMAGGANGITSTVAVKGDRMSRMTETSGQIIDLTEQKIYTVDVRRKEYTVMTFAQMREQMEKLKADMAKQQEQMSPEAKAAIQQAGRQLEFDVDVKPTGQQKAIAGQDAREFVVSIVMRQQGMKLEESGGMVMTTNVWMAPQNAAIDELHAFNLKFFKAVYGDVFSGMNPQQMGAISAILPGVTQLMERMSAETRKLQGTALSTTTVIESVKSAEQLKAAAPSGGGGIGGMIARRMARGQNEPRSKVMTTTHDYLTVAATAAAEDVAIPATFKEKK
jgi:hypothetical protein